MMIEFSFIFYLVRFSKTFLYLLLQIKVCSVVIHVIADWLGSWLITL